MVLHQNLCFVIQLHLKIPAHQAQDKRDNITNLFVPSSTKNLIRENYRQVNISPTRNLLHIKSGTNLTTFTVAVSHFSFDYFVHHLSIQTRYLLTRISHTSKHLYFFDATVFALSRTP